MEVILKLPLHVVRHRPALGNYSMKRAFTRLKLLTNGNILPSLEYASGMSR